METNIIWIMRSAQELKELVLIAVLGFQIASHASIIHTVENVTQGATIFNKMTILIQIMVSAFIVVLIYRTALIVIAQ